MRKVLAFLGIALVIAIATRGGADSPVTSTPFHQAYLDIEIVGEAKTSGVLTEKTFRYLSSPEHPIDVKAAIINALGWNIEGKKNSRIFSELLARERNVSLKTVQENFELLSADELFCLGYLQLMDDYFHPGKEFFQGSSHPNASNRRHFCLLSIKNEGFHKRFFICTKFTSYCR